jgi:drug/metabolite transporter (DMT)-like permease
MIGALLALASAAFFGLNNASIRRGVITSTVLQAMAITVPLAVPVFGALAALTGGFAVMAGWSAASWAWMAAAGVIHFVIGRYGNYRTTQALGATLSAPVQQLSIIVALALAIGFLGETITPLQLAGVALVMISPALAMRPGKRTADFEPQLGPGIAWGLVSALGYGTSPLLIVKGLAGGGYAAGIAGVFVSHLAATVVVLALVAMAGGIAYLRQTHRGAVGWYLASALFVALSQLFRYLALSVAPVSVVTPIQRTSVIFRILAGALINRRYELIDGRTLAAVAISLLGAVVLTAPSGWLVAHAGLGGAAADWLARPLF